MCFRDAEMIFELKWNQASGSNNWIPQQAKVWKKCSSNHRSLKELRETWIKVFKKASIIMAKVQDFCQWGEKDKHSCLFKSMGTQWTRCQRCWLKVYRESWIQNGETRIQNGGSWIQNGGSWIQNGETRIQNGETRIQNEGSWIQNGETRIQNGETQIQNGEPQFKTGNPKFRTGILNSKASDQFLPTSSIFGVSCRFVKEKWTNLKSVVQSSEQWRRKKWWATIYVLRGKKVGP